jgi:hypothetical protein
LELPIDHFRLLGVGPSTDAQSVLHSLQQRLTRPPDEGFSQDTLEAREQLLRASADLLSDEQRRASYEAALTALNASSDPVMPALDVPSPREVAGLLLLLEAGQAIDCFELASRSLQPPQAPALGSSREADLTLLAGLAGLAGAEEYHHQRRYEAAAQTLQQALQLLQRMGQRPELRERLQRNLERLTPYRVLDLLSRDLASGAERREGLALLEQMVERRGGLAGERDPDLNNEEFQAFFQQIRSFLTIQEQVDLFSRWGDSGSKAANFHASIALTASGFAQRKPERIVAARDRLVASDRPAIEPLLANLHLLLGDVDRARSSFEAGADEALRQWAAGQSSDPLAQLCAYCRDWLNRDVLTGYRDLDGDADLEAYFSDRDVVNFVEREDRRRGRLQGAAPATPAAQPTRFSPATAGPDLGAPLASDFSGDFGSSFDRPFGSPFSTTSVSDPIVQQSRHLQPEEEEEEAEGWSLGSWQRPEWLRWPEGGDRGAVVKPWLLAGVGAIALAIGGAWLLKPRPGSPPPPGPVTKLSVVPPTQPPSSGTAAPTPSAPAGKVADQPPSAPAPGTPTPSPSRPTALTMASPSAPQLQQVLEAWLNAKASVLAGQPTPAGLDQIARPEAIARLETERREDADRGQKQALNIQVKDVQIRSSTPARIVIAAELAYSDSRNDISGTVLERTAPTTLHNLYIFGRDGQTWRLAATRPGG